MPLLKIELEFSVSHAASSDTAWTAQNISRHDSIQAYSHGPSREYVVYNILFIHPVIYSSVNTEPIIQNTMFENNIVYLVLQ